MPDIKTRLVWITPEAEQVIAYCARVSNPSNQTNPQYEKLLSYCKEHNHWSVFEMASACVEIVAPRDITRQILRHRSFHFQEFSQRYADASQLGLIERECRLQDDKNRQNSIETVDEEILNKWHVLSEAVAQTALNNYHAALDAGIAKEVARTLLPEGLTLSRVYMQGTIRDWIHYIQVREGNGTQKEHTEVAKQIKEILSEYLPTVFGVKT